ncbi:MAG: L,D-transpeptidase family protein [Pseudomonadota bacterium]
MAIIYNKDYKIFGLFRKFGLALSSVILLASTPAFALGDDWGNSLDNSDSDLEWEQPLDRSFVHDWEINPAKGFPTISRKNITHTETAIRKYAAIASKGGWPSVKLKKGSKLGEGISAPAVVTLRKRLSISGDLRQAGGYQKTFDSYVTEAVKKFQVRHGLTPTGIVDDATVKALNVSAQARLRQLRMNLVRLRTQASSAAKRYVLVNIPAAQVEAVENDTIASRHAAVVGKVDRQTPILRSKIHQINFNPYWTIPRSIIRKDLIPQAKLYAKRGKDLLSAYRITAFDGSGRAVSGKNINWSSPSALNYRYRQDPWKQNSMGFVKINFHNKHAVYMHDTPSQSLFGRNLRAHSSGCIRVQNVKNLVSWILRDNGDWGINRIENIKQTGERQDVSVKKSVPVYFVYLTAWATPDGGVHFRRDLYRRDGVGVTASAY